MRSGKSVIFLTMVLQTIKNRLTSPFPKCTETILNRTWAIFPGFQILSRRTVYYRIETVVERIPRGTGYVIISTQQIVSRRLRRRSAVTGEPDRPG